MSLNSVTVDLRLADDSAGERERKREREGGRERERERRKAGIKKNILKT